ncbi:MAG: hypothetical protein ACI4GW_11540 [Lachnospiraceae bacterium]
MKFEIVIGSKIENTEERYLINDRSFDCKPAVNVDINVAMAYLNLGVDSENMCVKCLWGFSPRESWKEVNLSVPSAKEGELRLVGEYEAGLTWRIDKNKMWESYFDKESGWYCIGNLMLEDDDIAVKIINNMIAVVDNTSELKAVWVQPIFV